MINQDTTRAEKLSISIEETEQEIKDNINIINQLHETQKDLSFNDDIKTDFQMLIQKLDSKNKYLEEIKENDEEILNQLNNNLMFKH